MSRTILIVDDQQASRAALKAVLCKEYNVVEASGGREAVSLLRQRNQAFSAILLDLIMPDMDGYEVLRQIRTSPLLAQIPVIVTTGSSDPHSQLRALRNGATDYVVKPCEPEIVLARLGNLIRLRESSAIVNRMQRDRLTNLLNRESFLSTAANMIAAKPAGHYVMGSYDIDEFKVVNDQYGNEVGDRMLQRIAQILQDGFSPVDAICCRIAADDFAALYPADFADSPELESILQRTIVPDPSMPQISYSVGRYLVKDKDVPISAMLDRAMVARATVKGRFDNHVAQYDEKLRDSLLQNQEIVREMSSALAQGQFEVWFQPQYNNYTGELIGAEALARWRHPQKGLIPPGTFIPVFERNGFVYELDKCIWEQTCAFLRKCIDHGDRALPISVNISRYDVFRDDLIDVLMGLVAKYELPVGLLRLEITESAFAGSSARIIHAVNRFVELGFIVEIDDFGSGYSSLNTLKDVPAQVVKLDMRFLEGNDNLDRGGNIIESIVRMTKWLGMTVIAEGVETVQQATYLKSIGCEYSQGYFFGWPMPKLAYAALLAKVGHEDQTIALETVEHLDTNDFWSPTSMDTLIFNSYVGSACIVEYNQGHIYMLRVTDAYANVMAGYGLERGEAMKLDWGAHLSAEQLKRFDALINESLKVKRSVNAELAFTNLPNCAECVYLRLSMRVIAKTGRRHMLYCLCEDMTAQRLAEKKSAEDAQTLQTVMNNITSGISASAIKDGKPVFLLKNDYFYAMLGYTKEQFERECPNGLRDRIYSADYQAAFSALQSCEKSKGTESGQFRVRKRDGGVLWLHATGSVCYLNDMDTPAVLSVYTDITREKEAEARQRATSMRMEAILKHAPSGISAVVSDHVQTRFLFVNETFFEMMGYTREQYDAEVKLPYDIIHPEDAPSVKAAMAELAASGGAKTLEYRIIRRDKSVVWIRNALSVVDFEGVDKPVYLSIYSDVSELHAAEASRRDVTQRLQVIMDNVKDGVTAIAYRSAGDTETLFCNDSFYRMYGYTRDQFADEVRDAPELVLPRDRARVAQVVARVLRGRESRTHEYRCRTRGGDVVWTRATYSVISIAGHDGDVLLSTLCDVTAEKEYAEQTRFLNASAHEILSQPDSELSINDTLHKLMTYFDADRAYIVELDHSSQTSSNTYEICGAGVTPELPKLQNVPFSITSRWFDLLQNDRFVSVADVDKLGANETELRDLLKMQGIRSLILAPLTRDGVLVGYSGVDNPKRAVNQLGRLTALADYLTILLTRRDLERQVAQESQRQKQLLDNLPCGAALYEYDGTSVSVVHINRHYWALVERKPDEAVGATILDAVHADDRALITRELEAAIREKRDVALDIRIICGRSGYKPFHIAAHITPEDDGRCLISAAYTRLDKQPVSLREIIPVALSTVMSASQDLSYVKDRELRYLCCSRSSLEALGFADEKDVVGKIDRDLFSREIADRFEAVSREVLKTGVPVLGQLVNLPCANEVRTVSSSLFPIMDASGSTVGLYGVSHDVTQEREKEHELNTLLQVVPSGVLKYAADETEQFAYVNRNLMEGLGYTEDQFKTKFHNCFREMVYEADREHAQQEIARQEVDGRIGIFEYRVEAADGSLHWFHDEGVRVTDEEGKEWYYVTLVDVTKRVAMQEKLRVSEEIGRLALEHSGKSVALFDVSTRTLTFSSAINPVYELPNVLTGLPKEQIALGRVSPLTADVYTELFEGAARGEAEGSAVYQQHTKDGWRWLEAQYTTVFSDDGKPVSAVFSFVDVSERIDQQLAYRKWMQSIEMRPKESYSFFHCNLTKTSTFDIRKGELLSVAFDEVKFYFDDRTRKYVEQYVYADDQKQFRAFLTLDKLLQEYAEGRRSKTLEYRERTQGGFRWLRLTVDMVAYPGSKAIEIYLMFENIDEQKKASMRILDRAERDSLTGALNRETFIQQMEEIIRASKPDCLHALIMLDIDNFKHVNDTLGHGAGDQVLRDVTARIGSILRGSDLLGRMGGDEFFVFLNSIGSKENVVRKIKRILNLNISATDDGAPVSVSIGAALIPQDGADFDTLYKKVDRALYQQKGNGKNGYRFCRE